METNVGLNPMNHEIMTWTEIKSQMLNGLSHPGTPTSFVLIRVLDYTWLSFLSLFILINWEMTILGVWTWVSAPDLFEPWFLTYENEASTPITQDICKDDIK